MGISGPTLSATFQYDGRGRRAVKTINGQSTSFLYDSADVVRESGATGDAGYLRTLAIDEALTRSDPSGTLHYLPDALGGTVALTDGTGTVVTSYSYAPFGETTFTGTPSANPFQFTGRENDGTNLYYYRARYYDPRRGRFLQEDPIGLAGGPNVYAYVGGNPATYRDPTGLLAYGHHYEITRTGMIDAGYDARTAERLGKMAGDVDFLAHSPRWENAPWHAMCPSGVAPSDGIPDIQRYIDDQIGKCTSDGLARALHAAQDAGAPSHRGCQPWTGRWGDYTPWQIGSHWWRDMFPGKGYGEGARSSRGVLDRFKEKCSCMAP